MSAKLIFYCKRINPAILKIVMQNSLTTKDHKADKEITRRK